MDGVAYSSAFRARRRTSLWSWRRAALLLAFGSAVGWGILIGAGYALLG